MLWGQDNIVLQESKEFTSRFDCDGIGEVEEYVGCKIKHNKEEKSINCIHLVLLESYQDKYKALTKKPTTTVEAGTVLVRAEVKDKVDNEVHTYFRSGIGKLLHVAQWSQPEAQNSKRELARQGNGPVHTYIKAMHKAMECCVANPTMDDAPVNVKSAIQKIDALTVTDTETVSGVQCAQDMLYVKRVLEPMVLKVEVPMIL
eukprot:15364934-Ditylum_brightwellii.AAC.1